jgi:hypothetical protein
MSRRGRQRRVRWVVVVAVLVGVLVIGSAYLLYGLGGQGTSAVQQKPIILYVDQGNAVVNGSGLGAMLEYMSSRGFNTVFFQVYREGRLLFSPPILQSFVYQTHQARMKIFFALYITNASQAIPTSIYGLHEDGISLDMSTINLTAQQSFLATLKMGFGGETAVTTTDMYSPLKPDLLVLETYGTNNQQYIRKGIIASVGVFATSSLSDYQSQFQYALQNSDGVMVFDYYGLLKAGY